MVAAVIHWHHVHGSTGNGRDRGGSAGRGRSASPKNCDAKGFGIRHQAIALTHCEDDPFTSVLSTKTSRRQRYPRPPGSH